MNGLSRRQREKVVAEFVRAAEYEDAHADRAELDFADAPGWSAAAAIAPNARARAAELRAIAQRLESDTRP